MDRLMPVQTFSPEAVQRVLGEVKPLGELILDNDVNGRVELGVWKLHARPAVIGGDKFKPLGIIKREPLLRVRRRCGIVFHPPFIHQLPHSHPFNDPATGQGVKNLHQPSFALVGPPKCGEIALPVLFLPQLC